jgi:hypothetical protein
MHFDQHNALRKTSNTLQNCGLLGQINNLSVDMLRHMIDHVGLEGLV